MPWFTREQHCDPYLATCSTEPERRRQAARITDVFIGSTEADREEIFENIQATLHLWEVRGFEAGTRAVALPHLLVTPGSVVDYELIHRHLSEAPPSDDGSRRAPEEKD